MTPWGHHAILNIARCCPASIRSAGHISAFARALVERIDMKAFGSPQVVHFGTGNKAGFTLIQLIETSNIAGHFCEETGDVYLDVFSCKKFEMADVEATVRQYFKPAAIQSTMVQRQAFAKDYRQVVELS